MLLRGNFSAPDLSVARRRGSLLMFAAHIVASPGMIVVAGSMRVPCVTRTTSLEAMRV